MYKLTKQERNILRTIAMSYGCKVIFTNGKNGFFWDGNRIIINNQSYTFSGLLSGFFHELAHYVNWQTGRYPIYHNPKNFGKMHKLFSSYDRMIRYSLNAEIATDKLGAKMLKEWFPNIKYKYAYKNTNGCYQFLYGYYMNGV